MKKQKKTFLPKLLAGLLLFLFCLTTQQRAFAQNVTVSFKNVPLINVLKQIEKQSPYTFVYNNSLVDVKKTVSIEASKMEIVPLMNKLLAGTDITFKIVGKQITLSPKEFKNEIKAGQSAKQRQIKGTVSDNTKQPIVGVSVINLSTKKGALTDLDGNFVLDAKNGDRIQFSLIGMAPKEVAVTDGVLNFNIELASDNLALQDVIVIGYGSSNKKDFTGSVSSVKADEIKTLPAMSVDDALTGRAAGVSIVKADGSPGGAIRMRVRGGTSLIGGSDPLYIIDGVPTEVTNNYISTTELANPIEANYGDNLNNSVSGSFARGLNNLAGLNTNDIESIDILKDASATAIYGSKAANGVVIITTKKGLKDKKPQLSFNYYVGVNNPIKEKVLNAEQYKSALITSAQSTIDGIATNLASFSDPLAQKYFTMVSGSIKSSAIKILTTSDYFGTANTDWLDLVLRKGMTQNADFSISGGGQTSRYYTSLSYTDQIGTLIKTDFQRFAGKISLDSDITKRFRVFTNINFGYTKNNLTNGLYSQAIYAPPVFSPYNEDGTYTSFIKLSSDYSGYQNPMAVAQCTNEAKNYMMKGSMGFEIDILRDLKFKSTASIDYNSYNQLNYIPSYVDNGSEGSSGGTGSQAHSTMTNTFFENTLTYSKVFNTNHRLNALLGTSWEDKQSSYFSASGVGYPDDDYLNNLSSASQATSISGSNPSSRSSLLSFYLRLNYVMKEKYLLTFTGRSDASSKFAPDNRVGYFPSGAIAWIISEENFLKDVKWIDQIKIRASAGKTGTQSIGDHMWRTLYSADSYANASSLYPSQLGNNKIKWESTTQQDLGLDFGFFKNRLSGSFGYYTKVTDGALLNMTPAPSSGFGTVIFNLAKIKNKGIELDLRGSIVHGKDFSWNAALNIAHNESKVLNIAGDAFSDPTNREALNLGTSIVKEGEPLGLLYGRVVEGVIKTEEQLNEYKSKFPITTMKVLPYWTSLFPALGIGSYEYALGDNGLPVKKIIGNAIPDFFGGLNNTFSYKNFSLTTLFTFSYGNDLLYMKDVSDMSMSSLANRGVRVLKGWSETNTISGRPKSLWQNVDFLTNKNVYDASYIKLKSLSLSYTFSPKMVKKMSLSGLMVYVTGTNLFAFTKYPGPDPEVSDDPSSIIGGGRDVTSYPTTRSYTLGLRLSF